MLRSPNAVADLGPYDHDFTYKAEKGRVYNNNIGSGMFTDAFTNDLGDFGKVEERGVIDASKIKMTSYFGENSAGGATAITVGSTPAEEDVSDAPRTPPWEKSKDPLLSTPIPTTQESAQSSDDLLAFSKQVSEPQPNEEQPVETAATPPELPITAATPPSLPPNAPPTQPPSSPPSEKPTTNQLANQQGHQLDLHLLHRLENRLTNQLANQQGHQLVLLPLHRLKNQLANQQGRQLDLLLANQPANWASFRQTNRQTNRSTNWSSFR